MTMTNAAETDLLELLFDNVDWPNIGNVGGLLKSTADGSMYVSLHTADPTETGNQTSSEAAYGSYARQAVSRTAGWTVAGNNVSNAAAITFPEASTGSETETHFGIGTASTGVGNLLMSGALSPNIAVSTGIQPEFAIGACDVDAE